MYLLARQKQKALVIEGFSLQMGAHEPVLRCAPGSGLVRPTRLLTLMSIVRSIARHADDALRHARTGGVAGVCMLRRRTRAWTNPLALPCNIQGSPAVLSMAVRGDQQG
ncbi:hypothetical protein B9N43_05240 [Denitratisoma sp. DHT3]|nr:hypothetical protein B9N43_05240 [Denitratisoma sp. DHT3]